MVPSHLIAVVLVLLSGQQVQGQENSLENWQLSLLLCQSLQGSVLYREMRLDTGCQQRAGLFRGRLCIWDPSDSDAPIVSTCLTFERLRWIRDGKFPSTTTATSEEKTTTGTSSNSRTITATSTSTHEALKDNDSEKSSYVHNAKIGLGCFVCVVGIIILFYAFKLYRQRKSSPVLPVVQPILPSQSATTLPEPESLEAEPPVETETFKPISIRNRINFLSRYFNPPFRQQQQQPQQLQEVEENSSSLPSYNLSLPFPGFCPQIFQYFLDAYRNPHLNDPNYVLHLDPNRVFNLFPTYDLNEPN